MEHHARTRAKIRLTMLYFRHKLTTDHLPYHQLATVEESGTTPAVDTGEDIDVSEIRYTGVLGIRTEAWP